MRSIDQQNYPEARLDLEEAEGKLLFLTSASADQSPCFSLRLYFHEVDDGKGGKKEYLIYKNGTGLTQVCPMNVSGGSSHWTLNYQPTGTAHERPKRYIVELEKRDGELVAELLASPDSSSLVLIAGPELAAGNSREAVDAIARLKADSADKEAARREDQLRRTPLSPIAVPPLGAAGARPTLVAGAPTLVPDLTAPAPTAIPEHSVERDWSDAEGYQVDLADPAFSDGKVYCIEFDGVEGVTEISRVNESKVSVKFPDQEATTLGTTQFKQFSQKPDSPLRYCLITLDKELSFDGREDSVQLGITNSGLRFRVFLKENLASAEEASGTADSPERGGLWGRLKEYGARMRGALKS